MSSDEPIDESQHSAYCPESTHTHYFRRALRLRCPVCGEGKMFVRMTMWQTCPACGFPFEREPGYWTNAVTLNFMMTGGLAILLIAPLAYSGLPVLVVLALGLLLGTLFPLLCFRHMKALWLAIDLRIRPPTTFERLAGFLHVSGQQAAENRQRTVDSRRHDP